MRRREGEYDRESGCLGVAQVVDSLLEVLEREAADERTKRRVSYSLGPGRSRGEREQRTHKTMMVLGESRIHAGVHPLKKPLAPSCLNRAETTLPIDALPDEFMICDELADGTREGGEVCEGAAGWRWWG